MIARGSVGPITGSAAVTVVDPGDPETDPWVEPEAPEPEPGGSVEPPEPPEAQDPPVGVPDPVIPRYSEVMPEPTLGDERRPVNWTPTSVVQGPWGRLQVVVEGEDITYFRDTPVPFPTITEVEPFGYAAATIRVPRLTTFNNLGSGSLSWCKVGANVRVRVKRIGASGYVNLFRGFVESIAVSQDDAGVALECTGMLFQADKMVALPDLAPRSRDAGRVIASLLNNVPGRRYLRMASVTTGIKASNDASWGPLLTGAVQQLLSTMVDRKGRQYTVHLDGRRPVLERKNTTSVAWSVRVGQRGIRVDLERDVLPNVIYGEGVRPDGGRWRNAKYPNWRPDDTPVFPMSPSQAMRVGTRDSDTNTGSGVSDWQEKAGQPVTGRYSQDDAEACRELQRRAGIQVDGTVGPQTWAATFGTGANTGTLDGAFVAPLTAASRVMPRLYGPDGDDLGPNPNFNPDALRVEDVVAFGTGVTKSEARKWARRMRAKDTPAGYSSKSYHGTVRFELDPAEGHRLEVVRAGSNGVIRGVAREDVLVHVSQVTMTQGSAGGIVVTATVDTEARDYPTLAAIRARERNAVDPAKAFIKRRSGADEMSPRALFDAESPAGRLPRHALFPNLWTVVRVPFGDYGRIVRTRVRTSSPASPFALAVFSKEISASKLLSLVGNPLAADENPWQDAADDLTDAGLLMAWGWKRQPAGYYPHSLHTPDGESAAPVTGRLEDDSAWEYASESAPWVWVASIASSGCFISGRFYQGAI